MKPCGRRMSLLKFEHPIHCSLDFFLESMQLTTAKKISRKCALSIGVLQGTMKSLLIQMSFKLCLLLEDGRGSANAILDLGVLGANQPVPKLPVLTRCRTFDKYPTGVGLFPHVDTHSAFEGSIYSLSLLGSCIVEFRASVGVRDTSSPNFVRKAIYLPLQSMILLSGAGRYAWQHYIPHQHQQDVIEHEEDVCDKDCGGTKIRIGYSGDSYITVNWFARNCDKSNKTLIRDE
uniref:Putative alpha-ketoglutarate-dependent dioxygenase AlkB-like protein n=1 Tax=Helianthus annuus TaxID=4232 RepID=A0A251SJA1_HELAN